jgi:hypothetical protein
VFDIDFDIYTIVLLAFAVFIFLRLRSVLDQRTGRERRPYDPYSTRDAVRGARNDTAATLPGRSATDALQKTAEGGERAEQWKGIAEPDSAVAAGLDAIAREDKTFDPKHFISGARTAYEMIVPGLFGRGSQHAKEFALARSLRKCGFRRSRWCCSSSWPLRAAFLLGRSTDGCFALSSEPSPLGSFHHAPSA